MTQPTVLISGAGIAVMKWMQRWPLRPIAAKTWFTVADSIDLPHYPMV